MNNVTFAAVTSWINNKEAQLIRTKMIAEGKYTKEQIKLSSYRWADVNDRTKGYLCRVLAVKGIHSELEVGETRPRNKAVTTTERLPLGTFVNEQNTGNSEAGSSKVIYWKRNRIDETVTA